jgi:hypothetical protein
MLPTITTPYPSATDRGFLLYKHPDRVRGFDLPCGRAFVFYPEAAADRRTAALPPDADPAGPARGGEEKPEGRVNLHGNRLAAEPEVLKESGATRVLDLGGPSRMGVFKRAITCRDPAYHRNHNSLPNRAASSARRAGEISRMGV